jgi:hypothetical protein
MIWRWYGGHVRIVRIGGKFGAGLERYGNNVGSRNNVIFIAKTQMKRLSHPGSRLEVYW